MNIGNQTFQSYQVKGYRWAHVSNVEPTGEPVKTREVGLF